jgi:hypothetical protein
MDYRRLEETSGPFIAGFATSTDGDWQRVVIPESVLLNGGDYSRLINLSQIVIKRQAEQAIADLLCDLTVTRFISKLTAHT